MHLEERGGPGLSFAEAFTILVPLKKKKKKALCLTCHAMPLWSLPLLLSSARDHNIKWQAVGKKKKENNELTMKLCHVSYLIGITGK